MQATDREQDVKESSYTGPVGLNDLNGRYCSQLFREFWMLIFLCLEVNHEYEDMELNGKRLLRFLMYCLLATFDTMHILCYFLHILSRGFRIW